MARSDGRPENQHYVPKMLLKNFAFEGKGKEPQVHVFDKKSDRAFATGISNVAAERGFYELEYQGAETSLEPAMSDLETKTAGAFAKLLASRQLTALTPEEKGFVAVFLATQRHRVRAFREVLKHMDEAVVAKLRRMGADPAKVKGYAPLIDDEDLKLQASAMLPRLIGTVAPLLLDKKWVLFQPPPQEEFWISDNPVALHNEQDFGAYGNLGFAVRGIEIYLPLAPTLMLGVWCPSRAETLRKEALSASSAVARMQHWRPPTTVGEAIEQEQLRSQWGRASSELDAMWNSVSDGTAAQCTSKNMMFFNSLQVVWAERYVMSREKNWDFARRMLTGKPHIRQGPRLRLD